MEVTSSVAGRVVNPPAPTWSQHQRSFKRYTRRKTPPGDPIPICVAPFEIDDNVLDEREIADTVRLLSWGKSPGPSGIRAEHLREWLNAAERENNPDPSTWNKMVELVQHAFETG
jgi:hypothetical protein